MIPDGSRSPDGISLEEGVTIDKMKKPVLALLVSAGAVGAVLLLGRDQGGPLPSQMSLANYGFAVWPEDTLEEGLDACNDREGWRVRPRETARRFAREVLNYPSPTVGSPTPVRNHVRYLLGTRRTGELFLGSILDLRRYGRCWYVTQGQPREDALTASIGFVHDRGEPRLLISSPSRIPDTHLGYGDWEREIAGGRRRMLIDLPRLERSATGHAIFLAPDRNGISEYVGTMRLGAVPSPRAGPALRPLSVADVVHNPRMCRIESSPYRSDKAVIRHLFQWTFPVLLEQVDGFPTYKRRKATMLRSPDRWRLLVDDAALDLRVPEVAGRCWKLVSMVPLSGLVIREFRVGTTSVTFDIRWNDADSALIAFGTGFDGRGGTLARIDEAITFFRQAAPQPEDVPTYALVVLYRDGHVVAAQYSLYGPH